MVGKFINFRANEVSGGLGDPEAGLEAAKMMRRASKTGKHIFGGLPPKADEGERAAQKILNAEFDLRMKDESEEG